MGAPEIFNLAPSVEFQRPVTATPGLISLAHIVYKPGKGVSALEGFKALVASLEKTEKPVLAYTALLDVENETIRTVEVYESAEYYDEVHKDASSSFAKAIEENQKQNQADRTDEMGAVKLKVVQGFFGR
jgi:pyruvate kinase